MERFDGEGLGLERSHCGGGGFCTRNRGDDRDLIQQRCAADQAAVGEGFFTGGRIDDQLDLLVFDGIQHIGAAFVEFQHQFHIQVAFPQDFAGSFGGDDFEAEVEEVLGRSARRRLWCDRSWRRRLSL